jgi:sugar lactone lactonase YvrE
MRRHRAVHPLVLAAALSLAMPALAHPPPPLLETVATFDASRFEVPESIAIDSHGNRLVSLSLTGEIRKIAPDGAQSTLAVLPLAPPLTPCGDFFDIMGALAIDHRDNLYVPLDTCVASLRGVYRVSPAGETTLLSNLPLAALGDGITYRDGLLYVADADLGLVWRLPADGSAPAAVWAQDPLLQPSVGHLFPGPNGIQFFGDKLYVSNSDQGDILVIPVEHDGSAGSVSVHASGTGCDDFAFDVLGNLYCTTDPFNTLVRIHPDGSSEVLLTAADGLDGPTASLFGRRVDELFELYITNGATPFFSTTHRPSLMKLFVGLPGAPRP